MIRKEKINTIARKATFLPDTINEENRTIDVVWTTGSRVQRSFWGETFHEELSLKRGDVRLERLNAGAPVLNNHGTHEFGGVRDLKDVIGVVESAKIIKNEEREQGKEGISTLRFSEREDVEGIWKDVKRLSN